MQPAARLKVLLLRQRLSICVAESITAGHLQADITSVDGASEYFEGGVTTYNITQKVSLLGVNRMHAEEVNGVSKRVAREMAVGARQMFRAAIGVATTGYATVSADDDFEHPFAYFAIDINGFVTIGEIEGNGLDRVPMQDHVTKTVMGKLVELLDA